MQAPTPTEIFRLIVFGTMFMWLVMFAAYALALLALALWEKCRPSRAK